MMITRSCLCLAFATWMSAIAGAAQEKPPTAKPSVSAVSNRVGKVSPQARTALRAAAAVEARAKGLAGKARAAALTDAVAAYSRVLEDHGDDRAGSAQAHFATGELQRRLGQLAAAERSYARAMELDAGRYGERAGLQRGHMLRRSKKYSAAIEAYRSVARIKPGSARSFDAHASLARCHEATGDLGAAVKSYRESLAVIEKPTHVIDMCNRLAQALLRSKDLAAAGAAIARAERCRVEGDSREAVRIRKALDEMSARRALQRAKDAANGAAADAADVEKTKKGKR